MILHRVVTLNKNDEIDQVLWQQEAEDFDFARLYYEQQRQQHLTKLSEEDIFGIFSTNGYEWFYSLDKVLIMPSGEQLYFGFYEPDSIELAYFKHHSKPYLQENKNKKVI